MVISALRALKNRRGKTGGILCLFIVLVIVLCAGSGWGAAAQNLDTQDVQGRGDSPVTGMEVSSLLLNSGLTECSAAVVRYTLWTENNGMADELLTSLQALNEDQENSLNWHMDTLENGRGQHAVSLWAQENVTIDTEKKVWEKMDRLSQLIGNMNGEGGSADSGTGAIFLYLEERIDEAVSLEAYWQQEGLLLQQSSDDGKVQSWSGLDTLGLTPCASGGKLINVQLTTRMLPKGGKTVLAFPAMYNDI